MTTQNPNPTDYPHLEAFIDWLYEHVEELPGSSQELIKRMQQPRKNKRNHNSISLLRRWDNES